MRLTFPFGVCVPLPYRYRVYLRPDAGLRMQAAGIPPPGSGPEREVRQSKVRSYHIIYLQLATAVNGSGHGSVHFLYFILLIYFVWFLFDFVWFLFFFNWWLNFPHSSFGMFPKSVLCSILVYARTLRAALLRKKSRRALFFLFLAFPRGLPTTEEIGWFRWRHARGPPNKNCYAGIY